MPGCLVDGNDVLAVYQVVADAVARARAGDGPTLIEAITYRLGAHTTADDPTKYRPEAEVEEWEKRDPIIRYRQFLMDRSMLTEKEDKVLHEELNTEFEEAIAVYEALPPRTPQQHFDLVFAEQSPQLQRQQAKLLEALETEPDSGVNHDSSLMPL